MKKSNRHISHLGGMGSGDLLSTKLNQDLNPPAVSGGGMTGTADSMWSKKLGQLRVHIDDDDDLMFPENENIDVKKEKDTIRGKIPFDGRYKMRESKKTKKTLIDLFDDKYFEEDETSTHFKPWDTNHNMDEKTFEALKEREIEKNFNDNRTFDNATQKSSKLSIEKLNKTIKKEAFQMIKESIESKGLKLVLRENAGCSECGMMLEDCGCEEPKIKEGKMCEGCNKMTEACTCESDVVEELNTMASGNIATYMTKLSSPKSMKKHKKKMLPTGYKYR